MKEMDKGLNGFEENHGDAVRHGRGFVFAGVLRAACGSGIFAFCHLDSVR